MKLALATVVLLLVTVFSSYNDYISGSYVFLNTYMYFNVYLCHNVKRQFGANKNERITDFFMTLINHLS